MLPNKFTVPRTIRFLTEKGSQALLPTITNGRWMGPLISNRIASVIRKRSIIEGTYGKFIPYVGGWDPSWDKIPKIFPLRPLKGHKNERTRIERVNKIDKAMKAMPEKIKKYEQEIKDSKPPLDIFNQDARFEKIMERLSMQAKKRNKHKNKYLLKLQKSKSKAKK